MASPSLGRVATVAQRGRQRSAQPTRHRPTASPISPAVTRRTSRIQSGPHSGQMDTLQRTSSKWRPRIVVS